MSVYVIVWLVLSSNDVFTIRVAAEAEYHKTKYKII